MTKEEAVKAGVDAIKAAQVAADAEVSNQLGVAFEAGQASEGGGGLSQEQVDAQIAAAVQAKADADAVLLQQKQAELDALAQKEGIEADQLAKIKAVFGM